MNQNLNNKDKEYYIRQREIIKLKKRKSKIKQKEKRKKIRKEWFTAQKIRIKNYLTQLVNPNVLVSIVLIGVLLRGINQTQQQIEAQKAEIQLRATQLEEKEKNSSLKSSLLELAKENWPKIVVGTGTVLIPVTKHFYKN